MDNIELDEMDWDEIPDPRPSRIPDPRSDPNDPPMLGQERPIWICAHCGLQLWNKVDADVHLEKAHGISKPARERSR